MGMGSPGQMEGHLELCANSDLGAPTEKTKGLLQGICTSAQFKKVSI